MEIKVKSKAAQALCKHEWQEGIVYNPECAVLAWNLAGEKITTVCIKCGKIKSTRISNNADGS